MDANEGKAALRELVFVSARRATGTTANGERRCVVCVRCEVGQDGSVGGSSGGVGWVSAD